MERKASPWLPEIFAIFAKDVMSEMRTKVAVNAILLFSLTTLFLVSYVVGPYKVKTGDQAAILSAWLWIIYFFSAMSALDRTFVKEEETRTAPFLQMAARPTAVFFGKFTFNLLLMLSMASVLTPLYVILMEFEICAPGRFIAVVGAGLAGLTAGVTLVGAIVAKARMKGALFSILSFPVIIPLLLVAIEGTTRSALGGESVSFVYTMGGIGAFTGAMILVSLILFDKVWLT